MSSSGSDKANAVAAIDLLLNLLMLFVVIAAIAIAQMNRPSQEKSLALKAEMVIDLSWANNSFADLDLWVQLPDARKVGFTSKDVGVATLDRDDRGGFGDLYVGPQGEARVIPVNKETTVIRAILPGRYVVNVHYYHHYREAELGVPELDPTPDPVVVKLTKLNPHLAEIATRTVTLGKVGSQRTAFCFEVDAAGAVSGVDTECDVPFVTGTQDAPSQET